MIAAALEMISERGLAGFAVAELARAAGVSQAAPYRHFRDRNAIVAEIARRGFEDFATELTAARISTAGDPVPALLRCAQAHMAFAVREAAVYAAMFAPGFPVKGYLGLIGARADAFAVVRRVAQDVGDRSRAIPRPPALMIALHVWSLTHGIIDLYVSPGRDGYGQLPMAADELLEAGLLVYLRSLDIAPDPSSHPR